MQRRITLLPAYYGSRLYSVAAQQKSDSSFKRPPPPPPPLNNRNQGNKNEPQSNNNNNKDSVNNNYNKAAKEDGPQPKLNPLAAEHKRNKEQNTLFRKRQKQMYVLHKNNPSVSMLCMLF